MQDSPASILEISIASPGPFSIGDGDGDTDGDAPTEGAPDNGCGSNADLLVLQARSRRETLLWAKVLQVRAAATVTPCDDVSNSTRGVHFPRATTRGSSGARRLRVTVP